MDPLDAIRVTFFEECAELMESLEAGLLALHAGMQDADTVDAVFRAVHSIKGGAGAFDLDALVTYAHAFETALDALRSGRLDPSRDVVAVFLHASDRLGDLIAASRTDETAALPDLSALEALLAAPSHGTGRADPPGRNAVEPAAEGALSGIAPSGQIASPRHRGTADAVPRLWSILFEPLPDLLTSGNEPLFLFRALEVMGSLKVTALDDDLPALTEMDVRAPRLRWQIELTPSAPDLTETEIESIFEFAEDLCVLEIRQVQASGADFSSLTSKDAGLMTHQATPNSTTVTAPDGTGTQSPSPPFPVASAPLGATAPHSTTIRVDLTRVDRLVDLVGELVISQSMLAQDMTRAGLSQHSAAVSTLEELQQLTRDMQDSVMSIRAQPVKSLFQRMTRIVRETAQSTGKQVDLVTEGEATEIDKTVVERLADPLTHMIRNAIDHGLEAPQERADAGKPSVGTVRLSARQQSDRVVIEVSDDGRGIDRDRVLRHAIARGLVPEGKALDSAEIDRLLFLPGFTTNAEVSALSGRGVGMDVVERAIRDLNGSISLASTEGAGCRISISLPLTLAILDGMIVRSNRHRMVIPLSAIIETQTLAETRIQTVGPTHRVVQLHERFVPIIDLADGMGFPRSEPMEDNEDAALLFVEPDESGPFALCVDAIESQRQVVIKGLSQNFGNVPCVSAATILGDGQVALIVDPMGIAARSGFQHMPQAAIPEARAL